MDGGDPTFKKIVLLILDGFGVASKSRGNAISLATPHNLNDLLANYPALSLHASGPLVGLPWGEMGNSEVGHLNIGAGRIVSQDLPRITAAIQSGEFFKNQEFIAACSHVKQYNSKLHIVGMVSTGGVHSYDEHLYALLAIAAEQGLPQAYIHMITDGRDTEERAAIVAIEKLHKKIEQIGLGKVATIAGRFYAMDRGGHWDQTEMMYQAMVAGRGEVASSPLDCIAYNYAKQVYDEMIRPTVILENAAPVATVGENDAVIFFNFRQDRAIQLTQAFVQPELMKIANPHEKIANLYFVTMTEYLETIPVHIAFAPIEVENDLPACISHVGLKQFHCAESEKFAHVTSFFNGGKMDVLPGEERLIVSSPDNANNYTDHPEMSCEKITDVVVDKLRNTDINFYVINFANGDMVGHTGNLAAAVAAVQAMDEQLPRIAEAVLKQGGCFLITADHGNCEQMINIRTGQIDKDHSTAPVPFIVIAKEFQHPRMIKFSYDNLASLMPEGSLEDIGPTVLSLFGIPIPEQMTGTNLINLIRTHQQREI